MVAVQAPTLLDYLTARIEFTDECWLWTRTPHNKGYGQIFYKGWPKMVAHRAVWLAVVDPDLPREMTLDHLCLNKMCVNPDHLEPVTNAENNARGVVNRTRCKRGHPFEGDNIMIANTGKGRMNRRCRACYEIAMDAAKQRQRVDRKQARA